MDQFFDQKNAKMDPESLKSLENRVFGVFIPKLKFRNENSKNQEFEKWAKNEVWVKILFFIQNIKKIPKNSHLTFLKTYGNGEVKKYGT